MKCQCGGRTKVIASAESEVNGEHYHRRRRVCLVCRLRFNTGEIVLSQTDNDDMKPKKPKDKKFVMNSEQIKKNAAARRRLEELQEEESDDEIDEYLKGATQHAGSDNTGL